MDTEPATASPAGIVRAAASALLGGTSEASVTKRLAGTIFIIRVISAAMAYVSQILLARWMGGSDYGVYVYVWTWVLLLGSMMDFGISASAQKIIPEYRTSGEHALLRGFLSGSRWMTFAVSSLVSLLLAGLVKSLSPWIDPNAIVPLYIGCITLPAFVVANTQDGIARSHDWMRLGLMPQFIVRQSLIIGITAGAFALGFNLGATAAMLASAAAVWIAMIGQMIVLNRRLGGHIEPGPKAYDFRGWLAVSLPILLVESFYLLLSYTDVLVLQQFRSSEEVGVYFAVVKTLALVSFIHYAMSATTAHRFAEYHALGDKARLSAYVAHAIKWTFWPSLAATIAAAGAGQAAAVAVRAAIRGRLRHHVHRRYRPRGALRDRPGRAAAQHARPPAHLRAGLCAGLRDEPGALHRCWCRTSAAMARRPRPRSRSCSKPCCCSGSCGAGSGCTCWRSGSAVSEILSASFGMDEFLNLCIWFSHDPHGPETAVGTRADLARSGSKTSSSPLPIEIESELKSPDYLATQEELRIIDAAMASIDSGETAHRR